MKKLIYNIVAIPAFIIMYVGAYVLGFGFLIYYELFEKDKE